jgi:uncharacterized membrane protein
MLRLPDSLAKRIALFALSAMFVMVGVSHFTNPDFFVRIMPPYLPAHLELVYLSGVFEVIGGVAVLIPRVRALAGWGIILLLLAVYPANIHMALHPELFPEVSRAAGLMRLPVQFLFMGWAYWATR